MSDRVDTARRAVRKVLREVPVQKFCTDLVYVPVFSQEVRKVLQEETRQVLQTCLVIVPEVSPEPVVRKVLREVSVTRPCTREVYLPVTSHEPRPRLVYVEEPVTLTRKVPVIRVVSREVLDPATGKKVTACVAHVVAKHAARG